MSEDRGGGGRSPGVVDHEHADTQPWQAYAAATRPAATSSYRGVCLHKRSGRWQAAINVGGKHVYLGSFDTQEAAARQFDQVCLRVRGPAKAKLNFPLQEYVGPDGEPLPHSDPRLRQLVQEASSALTRRLKGQQGDEGHGHDDDGSGSKAGGAKRRRLEPAVTAPAPASAAAGGGGGGDRGGFQVSAESALMSRLGLGALDGLGRASAESLGLGLAPASGSAGGVGLGLGLLSGRSEGLGGGAGGMGALLRDNGGGSDLGRLLMLAAKPRGSDAASGGRLRDPLALGGASGAGAGGGRSVGALEALAPPPLTSRVTPPPARTEALLEALLRSELGGRQELVMGVGPSGPGGLEGGSLEGALLQALLRRELGSGGPSEDRSGLPSAPPPQAQQQRSGFSNDSLQVLSRLGLGMGLGGDAQLAAAALRRREDAEAAAAPAAEADLLRRLLAALLPGSQPAAAAAGGHDASRSPRAPRSPVLDHHPTRDWDSAAALTGSGQPTLASAAAAAPRPAPPAPPPSAESAQAQLIGGLLGSFHQHLPAGAVLDALVPATRDLLGYTYMLPPAATRSGDVAGRGPGGSESPARGSARAASVKAEGATWSGAGPAHTEGAGRAGRTAGAGIYTRRGVFRDLGSYTTPEDALQACQASLSALLDAGRLLPPHEDAADEPPAPAPAPVYAPAAAARAKTEPEVQAPPGPSHTTADAHTASAAGAAASLLELALAGAGGSTAELLARLNELSRLPEAGHSDALPRLSEVSLPPPRALRKPPASPPPGRGLPAGGIPAFGEGCSGSLPPAKPSQGGVRLGPVGLQLLAAQLASSSAPQQHHQPQQLLIKPLNVERPSWGSTEENTLNDQQPADPQPGHTDAARACSGNGRDGSGSGGGSPSSSGLVPGGDARSRLKRPLSRSSGGGASPATSSPHKTSSGVPGEWRAVHADATTVSRPGLGAGQGGVARAEGREVSGLRASSPRHSGGSANRAGSLPHPSAAAGSCACSTGACIAITA